ncbi:MAG: F0F1 ATP synthase subunit alpha, partial [bacterium]|nr:F0F1 ATP synthase subunit alpha [bacterium]
LQVVSIFAATRGYLDDIPTDQIQNFEVELHKMISENHPQLREEIVAKGDLDAELEGKIAKVLEECKSGFNV